MTTDEIFAQMLADALLEVSLHGGPTPDELQAFSVSLAKAWKAGMAELLTREFRSTSSASCERQ